jgi:DNA-binding IclR family transcriptional regulator
MTDRGKSSQSEVVTAVARALTLLDAFTIEDSRLSLAELSRRAKLPKTSTLRLARTLAAYGYLVQLDGGAWRLGPSTARLAARYKLAFDIHNIIEPVMRRLARATRQGVSYFVHDGNARVRLLHVAGEESPGRNVSAGESLPLDRGSPGQVLLAFSGRKGSLYDEIRQRGFHLTIGEAKRLSASVSAPVYGVNQKLLGALCIGLPASGASEASLRGYVPGLLQAAGNLSRALSADQAASRPLAIARQTWRPI